MKKLVLFAIVALMACGVTYAQKPTKEEKEAAKALKAEIKAANKTLKTAQGILTSEGANLAEAEKLINQAIENPHTKVLADTWNTAGQIQKKLYDKENEKMYLQQPYSEDVFFGSLSKMFTYFNKCDEIESQPNAKGKVVRKYREANAEQLQGIRPNLVSGGVTYFNKDDNQRAYDLFSQYIESANYPMLEKYNFAKTDTFINVVSYYASLAGMKMEKYDLALKYIDNALDDPEVGENAMQYKCMAYGSMGDTIAWVKTLKEAVEKYPNKDYFYSNLISYYNNHDQNDELMAFADNQLKSGNDLPIFYFVKGFISQNAKDYDAAIEQYKNTIEKDPNYVGAYRNLGICYCQLAQDKSDAITTLSMKSKEYKNGMEEVKAYYRQALPIYEKLRTLDDGTDPDVKIAWQSGLYTCYYMLNMGPEFEAIEKEMGM
ncbi:MAG: tetratricopeptide repeat protein [Bacteroidaceae bacterium]|nr:tetratricopeptide repeat protein [Bacteroidaceae bacterium]